MDSKNTTLQEYLSSLDFPTNLPCDGTIHRFQRHGSGTSAWFIGHIVTTSEGGSYTHASFGDWRTDEKYEWSGWSSDNLTEEDRQALRSKYEEQRKTAEAERLEQQRQAALHAKEYINSLGEPTKLTEHPYLVKKQVSINNCYMDRGLIVVPILDENFQIVNYQTIDQDGNKMFASGGRVSGCFFVLQNPPTSKKIYFAEGLATAASIGKVTADATVVVCFNAGNMHKVVQVFAEKYPDHEFHYCADNDQFTTRQGKPYNPGVEAAVRCQQVRAGIVHTPQFERHHFDQKPTDWNDFCNLYGVESLKAQLHQHHQAENKIITLKEAVKLIPPMPVVQNKHGKTIPPEQSDLANWAAEHLSKHMIKQDRDVFFYTGTHWKHLDTNDIDKLKVAIMQAGRAPYTSSKCNGVWELFVTKLPSPKIKNIFEPRTGAVNFLNGTLFLEKSSSDINKRELVFRTHNKEDYLINVLPYNYSADSREENKEFLDMLARVCKSDDPRETQDKIEAIQKLFGACLAPEFPIFYFLYGPPATGKSTILKILNKFIHEDNISRVDPGDLLGFNLESMAGKLVNMDADIDINKPIQDSVIKKVIDRMPVRIQRKNRTDLYAPLPAVQVFGANELPRTMDRGSGAHQRRWVLVEFTNVQIKANGPLNLDYSEWCYNLSPHGILNFALEGLRKLCESGGVFTRPASGLARLEEWEKESNPVALFLDDIANGEITDRNTKVELNPDSLSNRKDVWDLYKKWSESANKRLLGRNVFYRELNKKGIRVVRKANGFMVRGIKTSESKTAEF